MNQPASARPLALAVALLTLGTGCNGLLGMEDVSVDGPEDGAAAGGDVATSPGGLGAVAPTTTLNCAFKPTDPGVGPQKQLPLTLAWKGYAVGSNDVETIVAGDFYDCNGSKGIDVVVYEMAKFFCGACEQDAKTLEQRLATWRAEGLGVAWVTVLVSAPDGASPATTEGAKIWREKHGFQNVHVVADPSYQLLPPGKQSFGTPSFVVVDPRTQTVVKWQEGLAMGPGGQDETIVAVAKKNAGTP